MRTPRGNISFNQTGRDPKAAMSQGAPRSNKMSRYKISKDLDSTVTADFHLARNVKKDENVLMKILKKNYYTLEECKANKEVQICLKLNHKNVLKFVEFINDNNQLLMIFEYLPDNAKGVLKKRYLAPEILLQIEKYGTPVDIWAAGCVMAELLTGTPLFQGDQMDTKDLMSKICVAIGTLTKSEWQEGTQALRQAMFNLPKVDVGRGLGDQGNGVSPNAKGLIMDMLVWNPGKRKTADKGFESSNPLLGDSTPRGRWGGPQPQAKLGVKGGSDDPFGQFRPQRLQEVRRPRPAAMQSTLFGPADDSGKGPADLQGRAEKLKQSNPNKFKDRYGNDFMRSQLGGNQQQQADTNGISTPQGRRVSMHNRDPVRSRQPSRVPSNNSLLNGMRISQADAHYAPPVGENQQSPMDEMTDPYSQSRGSQQNGNDPFMQGQARQQNGNDPSMQGQARQQNGHDQFTQNEISGNRPSNNPEWLESNNQHNTNTLPPVHNGNDVTSRPQRRRFADGDDEKTKWSERRRSRTVHAELGGARRSIQTVLTNQITEKANY
ncbi:CDKF4-like protein [Mya arenaria]|uniref:CDKF4-like protein n=1 Tax=Mya arenaria TaxID=6604 RepID=A0ABY7FRM0_MYAAR|nr:CDKF4-like protein [Mya arenaria]